MSRSIKWPLFQELAALAELVELNTSLPTPIRLAFARLTARTATVRGLTDLRAAFYALPMDDQRRTLCGWRPAPVPGDRDGELNRLAEDMPLRRIVRMRPGDSTGGIEARSTFAFSEHYGDDVAVDIREGATREIVMDQLARLWEHARDHWPAVIDNAAHEKAADQVNRSLPCLAATGANESNQAAA